VLAPLARFVRAAGDFQSRLVLGLVYFVVVPPFALIARVAGDPFDRRTRPGHSHWKPHKSGSANLPECERQF
jgi:hypothetical protein